MNRAQEKKPQLSSEIRKHYFLDRYCVIAPLRNLRPDSFSHAGDSHKSGGSCHFCDNDEPSIWQAPSGKDWKVKVIANAFPALSIKNQLALGVQEVVIDTPDHAVEFSELSLAQIQLVFEAYRRRLNQLISTPGIRYVFVFKNDGPQAGATVSHAHSQIMALPLIPPKIAHESDALNHYWDSKNHCAYCDIIDWELNRRVRVIHEDKHFIAISPYAAEFAFEVWLLPRRHEPSFNGLHTAELDSLAVILKKIAAKLDSETISFNFFLQESLPGQNHHFVLKVEPRTTKWGGAELGVGVIINPVSPEYAALWYNNKA